MVFICNLFDQIDLLSWDLRSAVFVSAFPSQIQFEALLMPFDHRFRLDDKQCILPRAEEVFHDAEEKPIAVLQSQLRRRTGYYFQLLSEKYNFELKLGLRFEESEREQEERSDHLSLLPG